MNVEIGTEAAQFPEKEYVNGIFLALHDHNFGNKLCQHFFLTDLVPLFCITGLCQKWKKMWSHLDSGNFGSKTSGVKVLLQTVAPLNVNVT
jgi:hypothetical protein